LSLTEKALIQHIRGYAKPHTGVVLGIGDDCSVLRVPAGNDVLLTTDFTLENVHFRREWHSPEVVGHRCLARGISDIAAMAGKPVAAFLSLALPEDIEPSWPKRFIAGMLRLADSFDVSLAGGDTAQSPELILADIVVLGSVPKGKAIRRSGARAGDQVYVTGRLGGAAATLDLLRTGRKLRAAEYPEHFHPKPRVQVASFLRQRGVASAMIDISDGLSTDLGHICEESEVGAEIHADAIPRAYIGKHGAEVALRSALHGGDDYELLFTAPPRKHLPARVAGVPTSKIGVITANRSVFLLDSAGKRTLLKPQGWQHFTRRRP
jgi:thiamine-monophosphate kinase